MAEHVNSTPHTTVPIDLTNPRKEVEDSLYEIGVIAEIMDKLATLMISTREPVCGTSFEWLAGQLSDRQELIREHIAVGSFGRSCRT